MSIEETLLEYHYATGKNWAYSIEPVEEIPFDVYDIRSVCINNVHIQFYEKMDIDNGNSTIFWKLDFIKTF
ncbi:hypothetical protein [Aquimarina muelleri]|nr:hypothetical protein [Aquimarina muelleri]MCX2764541.1 hypothetical protein [Aquimarina muelleri]